MDTISTLLFRSVWLLNDEWIINIFTLMSSEARPWISGLPYKAIAVPLVAPGLRLVVNTLAIIANVVSPTFVIFVSRPVVDR